MQKECSRILQEVEKVIKGKEQEKKLENVAMPAPANFHTLSQVFHAIGVVFCAV